MSVSVLAVSDMTGKIFESGPSGILRSETGYWTFEQIPEPSGFAVLGITAAIGRLLKRARLS